MRHVKNVHFLPNTNILIDFWKPLEKRCKFIRFMTIFRLTSEQLQYIKDNDYKIYTSCLNKVLLERHKILASRIVAVEPHNPIIITDDVEKYFFKVSVIDSNYCIGSCMFLFQGPFGTILYTGFFRPAKTCYPLYNSILEPLIRDRLIDVVYIDNSYAAEHCQFPSRAEVIEQTINIIKEHSDCKIIISMKKFGKEEILRDIAVSVNEKIGISKEKYAILSPMSAHLKNFSVDREQCRIIVEDELFTLKQCKEKLVVEGSTIIILLTAYYICEENLNGNLAPQLSNMYILPYSSHASHSELMNFLYHLKARRIEPIILGQSENTIIPQKMLDLCFTDEESAPLMDSDFYFASNTDTPSNVNNPNNTSENSFQLNNSTSSNVNETTLVEETSHNSTSSQVTTPTNNNNESTHIDTEEFCSITSDEFYESQTSAFQTYMEEQEEEILVEGSNILETTRDPLSISNFSQVSAINDSLQIESDVHETLPTAKSISSSLLNSSTSDLTPLENDVQNSLFCQSMTSIPDRLLTSDEKVEHCCSSNPEDFVEQEQACLQETRLEREHNINESNSHSQAILHNNVFGGEVSSSNRLESSVLVGGCIQSLPTELSESEFQNQSETDSNISIALSSSNSNNSDQQQVNLTRQNNEELMSEEERRVNIALYHHWLKWKAEGGQPSEAWKDLSGEFLYFL